MVAKLECHLINTQGPVTDPLTRGALNLGTQPRQMRNSTHSFLSECVGRPLKGNDGIDLRQTERVRVGVAVLDHLDPPIAREA